MLVSSQHHARAQLLSESRLSPYMDKASHVPDRAWDLYLWATQMSGALHAQMSFVELAVRNSLDRALSDWNAAQGGAREWTLENAALEPLYSHLRGDLNDARKRAKKESDDRSIGHPRKGLPVTHDDVVAQLMFGTWVKLIIPMSSTESDARHQTLWAGGVHRAFSGTSPASTDRLDIGTRLNHLRKLRNRVAHHDSILEVRVAARLNELLGIASRLDPDYPGLIMRGSQVRRVNKEDPRKTW